MKTLEQFITEAKAPKKGTATLSEIFKIMIDPDAKKLNLRDFEEVQNDDWIWDLNTGDVIEPKDLYKEYTDNGDTEVRWSYDEKNNEYRVEGGNIEFHFDVVEPYPNGLNY